MKLPTQAPAVERKWPHPPRKVPDFMFFGFAPGTVRALPPTTPAELVQYAAGMRWFLVLDKTDNVVPDATPCPGLPLPPIHRGFTATAKQLNGAKLQHNNIKTGGTPWDEA